MKNFVPLLTLVALSLWFSGSAGLAGSAALHGPAPVAGTLRCVKDRITVEGVAEERAILFLQDGFSCKPA